MEAMKMEHTVKSERAGFIRRINIAEGDIVVQGYPLFFIDEGEVEEGETQAAEGYNVFNLGADVIGVGDFFRNKVAEFRKLPLMETKSVYR